MLKSLSAPLLAACMFLAGCATVPMAPHERDARLKSFTAPAADKSGIYIYRDTFGGQALKKDLYIDGQRIGETANKVYFYQEIAPGAHKIATESEFSNNEIDLQTEGGKNYFVEQYIKLGVFVGGANLEVVSEEEGEKEVRSCKLAYSTFGNYPKKTTDSGSSARISSPSNTAAVNTRYLYQAESVALALNCTATTFTASGPGTEFYSANCGDKPISIRCDFGKCAAQ
ncbi:MAG TPA: DUF2846 domain-containing protein [Spongiibacteraceae bacterium]|nr:DUF2846 domain-containing protein [Spongiibacteraceae bacterium]